MHKIVQHLPKLSTFMRLTALGSLLGMVFVAIGVTLRHMLVTPQPLESLLPGEAHLYRWRHGHIFYKTIGDSSMPPLVLIHAPSIGASAYEMHNIVAALAQDYYVYAPDLLGFGLSDRPRMQYAAETYIALCHDFLTDVVKQPASLLASGLSCDYAVMVARDYPESCTKLVLISPMDILSGTRKFRPWSTFLALPAVGFFLYALLCTRLALRLLLARRRSPHQGPVPRSEIDYLYALTHQFGGEHAPLALLAGTLSVMTTQAFDTLPQPTLILWGIKALNAARSIANADHLPHATEMALIQEAGAYVHEECPAIVVAHMREWSHAAQTDISRKQQEKLVEE